MKKTVYIISFNKLSLDFWKSHINEKHASVRIFGNPLLAVSEIHLRFPALVIVDEYFSTPNVPYAHRILKAITSGPMLANLIYLSPRFALETQSSTERIPLVECSNFDVDFIDRVNYILADNAYGNDYDLSA